MEPSHKLPIILSFISLLLTLILLYTAYHHLRSLYLRRRQPTEKPTPPFSENEAVGLICFPGGEELTVQHILEAPGVVVGKSGHGTLYRATILRNEVMLRFVRPECGGRVEDVIPVVRRMGSVRCFNVVELWGLYVGPRGEKLLVSPFVGGGNLSRFLQDWNGEPDRWENIHRLALGIGRGLDYLHNGLKEPIIHGNLKTKNILLDSNNQPLLSDYGLHLILNSTAAQQMLEASGSEGYKAPELLKIKDANKETDIYSLGVILFEMVTRNGRDEVANRNKNYSPTKDEGLLVFFQLAMSCCSPSPALRPDARQVVRKLEEIGW